MLEQNYRSTQTILDAAQNVVRRNRLRKDKRLWTALGTGEKVLLHEAYNEEEEGLFVAREITRLLARGDIEKRGDVAVMYRTNAQSRALEEQFLRTNIPYKVIGSRKFYERKEIKDMIAYLRLLANPYDELSLQRIINLPPRGLGAKTVDDLLRWAAAEDISPYEALVRVAATSLNPGELRNRARFSRPGWRPGRMGAFRMGLEHGAYCVGCCWFLMGLLFFGGIMNLYWILGLAVFILIEKTIRAGDWIGRMAGVGLVGWGVLLLVSMP